LAGREEQAARWGNWPMKRPLTCRRRPRAIRARLDALRESTAAFADVTYAQLVEQLDGFYRPEKNRRIPLEQALTVVRQALAGVDQQYLYCQIEYFRLAHDSSVPMKERLEALGKKAAECAEPGFRS
jgi:hypothetical protein